MNWGQAASACNSVFKKHVRPKLCNPAIWPRRCRNRDEPRIFFLFYFLLCILQFMIQMWVSNNKWKYESLVVMYVLSCWSINLIACFVIMNWQQFFLPEGPQKTKAPRVTTAPVTTAIKIRSFSMSHGGCLSSFNGINSLALHVHLTIE